MSKIADRLQELGIVLPTAPAPVAAYVPVVIEGGLAFVSGQVSFDANGGIRGKLGAGLTLEQGYAAARLCGLNLLAQMQAAVGDLDRIRRVARIGGFVNCAPDFAEIPQALNGCSELLVEVFGDAGRHARAAVGVANLPLNFAVEADAVFALA